MKTPLADWYWARDHADPKIQWLWERGEFAANRAFVDAGMTLYWLAGVQHGGLQDGSPEDIRGILAEPEE